MTRLLAFVLGGLAAGWVCGQVARFADYANDAAAGLPVTWSRATIAVAVAAVTGAAILTSRPDKDRS